MPIREFFHIIHVVDDIDQANARYNALFGVRPYSSNWSDLDRRWASFSMLSDMMLEVIQPSSADEDANRALPKFHRRFGQHFHSLAWYVDLDDMAGLFRTIKATGARIAKPGGGLFADDVDDPGMVMFTHPKDTAGQLEFVGIEGGPLPSDLRSTDGWAPPPATESPLTVERVSHYTTGVHDLPRTLAFYEQALGAQTLRTTDTTALVRVGTESIVELATPAASELLARDMTANGELPHAVTFKVTDLDAVERHAASVGVRVLDRSGDTVTLRPDDVYNAVLSFTDRDIV